jgi:hypothetical protein
LFLILMVLSLPYPRACDDGCIYSAQTLAQISSIYGSSEEKVDQDFER